MNVTLILHPFQMCICLRRTRGNETLKAVCGALVVIPDTLVMH